MPEKPSGLVSLISKIYSPIIKMAKDWPPILAYGLPGTIAVLLIILFKPFVPGNLIWLLAIVILAPLAGYLLTLQNSSRKGTSASESHSSAISLNAHQAAAICFRRRGENLEFLLILNDKGTRRIFPKGNVKEDETLWAAAEREAMEEAGVEGNIRRTPLTFFWISKGKKQQEEMAIAAFLLEVTRKISDKKSKRKPKWYSYQKAIDALGKNRDPEAASELQRVLRKAISDLNEA